MIALEEDQVWKLIISTVGIFVFAHEWGHIIALLVGTISLTGAVVLSTAIGGMALCIGDIYSITLRLREHELDRPNPRLMLVDNSFAESYFYSVISFYYGPNVCRDQLVTNVTTNMVSEYDPTSGVGLPYNHFHAINPNSYLLNYVFMGVVLVGLKGLSVWLIKWKCQF